MGFSRYNMEIKAVKLYTDNRKKRIRELSKGERESFYEWFRSYFSPMYKAELKYKSDFKKGRIEQWH